MKHTDVSTVASYVSTPTPFTRRMRVFFPYQLFRFAVINWKMIRMLAKAHVDTHKPRGKGSSRRSAEKEVAGRET